MDFTTRKQERQAKMVCRFIEGHRERVGRISYRPRGRKDEGGRERRYKNLEIPDQGVTGLEEGMCGGSRPPISKHLVPLSQGDAWCCCITAWPVCVLSSSPCLR